LKVGEEYMAYINIYAYNEATELYDMPISRGDGSAPITAKLSKLKAMTIDQKLYVEKVDATVYQSKLSFLNDASGRWQIALDYEGAGPGTFGANLTVSSFPAYIWVRAVSAGNELIDNDTSVDLKSTTNQDFVNYPTISTANNTAVAAVAAYNAGDPTTAEAILSAWPVGESRNVKNVSVWVRSSGIGTLFIMGKTASGNNQIVKPFAATPGSRLVTVDITGLEPYTSVVLRSYKDSDLPSPVAASGSVSNVVISSDPTPADEPFDTVRQLLLLGDADFDSSRMTALTGLVTDFDTSLITYMSTSYAADTLRANIGSGITASFDTSIMKAVLGELDADTQRLITKVEIIVADTIRSLSYDGEMKADTMVKKAFSGDLDFDTMLKTKGYYSDFVDTVRILEERLVKKNYFFIS
jgi:hypothetical protein